MGSLNKPKKHLSFTALRGAMSSHFDGLSDPRTGRCTYSLHDTVMSAFACMYFQDPSLLKFQERLEKKYQRSNLQNLFRVKQTPKDSQLRDIIDALPNESFAPLFKEFYERLRRNKHLEDYAVLPNTLMCVMDGTQYHSSESIHCQHCLRKTHRGGETTYSHAVLQGAIMHPDKKQVLPVMPEAISNQDGTKKQDCETNAAKRFIEKLRQAHPRQKFLLGGDGLMSTQPMIETAMAHNMSFLFVAKPGDHTYLFEWIAAYPELPLVEFVDGKGSTHRILWQNDVPLHGGEKAVRVNYIEYQIWQRSGKRTYRNSWVTDVQVTKENAILLGKAGRCRWKIENECFNSLKTQGYELEHNYGHGQKNLSFNMYLLTLLAFFFHQIFELTDGVYQACRKFHGSKTHFWENFRVAIRLLIVESWDQLMDMLLNEDDYDFITTKRS